MIELANAYDVLIVEDNPYGGVRFAGETLPPVKHFDTEGRVIYISTFSKIFAPGLRIGWVCADEAFIDKYVAFKQVADLHTDSFAQRVTAKYMELYDIEEHIQKLKLCIKSDVHKCYLVLKNFSRRICLTVSQKADCLFG